MFAIVPRLTLCRSPAGAPWMRVVIVICPRTHPGILEISSNSADGDLGKGPVSLITIKEVSDASGKSTVGNEDIQKTVVVVCIYLLLFFRNRFVFVGPPVPTTKLRRGYNKCEAAFCCREVAIIIVLSLVWPSGESLM
jgi:hypothetical protein